MGSNGVGVPFWESEKASKQQGHGGVRGAKSPGARSKGRLSVHDRAPEGPARGARGDRARVWVGKRQAASGCWVGKRRACSKLTPMSACALHPCSILHHCSAQLPNVVSVAWRAGGSPGAPEARLARRRLALVSSAHQGTKTLNGLAFLAVPKAHFVVEPQRLLSWVPWCHQCHCCDRDCGCGSSTAQRRNSPPGRCG